MFLVFFTSFAINKNIIQIDLTKLIQIFKQQVVYVMLSIDKIVD